MRTIDDQKNEVLQRIADSTLAMPVKEYATRMVAYIAETAKGGGLQSLICTNYLKRIHGLDDAELFEDACNEAYKRDPFNTKEVELPKEVEKVITIFAYRQINTTDYNALVRQLDEARRKEYTIQVVEVSTSDPKIVTYDQALHILKNTRA